MNKNYGIDVSNESLILKLDSPQAALSRFINKARKETYHEISTLEFGCIHSFRRGCRRQLGGHICKRTNHELSWPDENLISYLRRKL